jgi:hypothetical protein
MLQVVTPEKTKAKRCLPPTLCELTIDTRTTGAQLSLPVSKDELRCAYAIVKRLLHQNKGDGDKEGTVQLHSTLGGRHLWLQKIRRSEKEAGINMTMTADQQKSARKQISQTAKFASPPNASAKEVLTNFADSNAAKSAGLCPAAVGACDLESAAVQLGQSGNQTRRMMKITNGKIKWSVPWAKLQSLKQERRLEAVYTREPVTREKDGKTMQLGFMRMANICDLIAARWAVLLGYPGAIRMHEKNSSTWTLMYDLGGKEMKFVLQPRDVVDPGSSRWCSAIGKIAFTRQNKHETAKLKLDGYECVDKLLNAVPEQMLASLKTQLESWLPGAELHVWAKQHAVCIPEPYAEIEFADFCLSSKMDGSGLPVLQLTKAELRCFLANCDTHEDSEIDKWVPLFCDGKITHVVLLEQFSFTHLPGEIQLGLMSEPAKAVLLNREIFQSAVCYLDLKSIGMLKQTAPFMNCHASNAAPDSDAVGGVHVRLDVDAVQCVYPPIDLSKCCGDCELENCNKNKGGVCECSILPFCIDTAEKDHPEPLTIQLTESSDSKGVCAMRGMQEGGNMTCGCCICTATIADLKEKKNDSAPERTVENCDALYALSSASVKPGGAEFKNIIRPQLLNLGPENTVPTPLHIMLGEGNYIIGMLQSICQEVDAEVARHGYGPVAADRLNARASAMLKQITELKAQKAMIPAELKEIKSAMKSTYKKINAKIGTVITDNRPLGFTADEKQQLRALQ